MGSNVDNLLTSDCLLVHVSSHIRIFFICWCIMIYSIYLVRYDIIYLRHMKDFVRAAPSDTTETIRSVSVLAEESPKLKIVHAVHATHILCTELSIDTTLQQWATNHDIAHFPFSLVAALSGTMTIFSMYMAWTMEIALLASGIFHYFRSSTLSDVTRFYDLLTKKK